MFQTTYLFILSWPLHSRNVSHNKVKPRFTTSVMICNKTQVLNDADQDWMMFGDSAELFVGACLPTLEELNK